MRRRARKRSPKQVARRRVASEASKIRSHRGFARAAVRMAGSVEGAAKLLGTSLDYIQKKLDARVPGKLVITHGNVELALGVARHLGFDDYLLGSCGPAAVAINRVLFQGKGSYCIAEQRDEYDSIHGHVVVIYDEIIYDYCGRTSLDVMTQYIDVGRPFKISVVDEKIVRRSFCPRSCLPVARAVRILERALRLRNLDPSKPHGKKLLERNKQELATGKRRT